MLSLKKFIKILSGALYINNRKYINFETDKGFNYIKYIIIKVSLRSRC
jgi:hypothetical protein